jgi:hypothetical protein
VPPDDSDGGSDGDGSDAGVALSPLLLGAESEGEWGADPPDGGGLPPLLLPPLLPLLSNDSRKPPWPTADAPAPVSPSKGAPLPAVDPCGVAVASDDDNDDGDSALAGGSVWQRVLPQEIRRAFIALLGVSTLRGVGTDRLSECGGGAFRGPCGSEWPQTDSSGMSSSSEPRSAPQSPHTLLTTRGGVRWPFVTNPSKPPPTYCSFAGRPRRAVLLPACCWLLAARSPAPPPLRTAHATSLARGEPIAPHYVTRV